MQSTIRHRLRITHNINSSNIGRSWMNLAGIVKSFFPRRRSKSLPHRKHNKNKRGKKRHCGTSSSYCYDDDDDDDNHNISEENRYPLKRSLVPVLHDTKYLRYFESHLLVSCFTRSISKLLSFNHNEIYDYDSSVSVIVFKYFGPYDDITSISVNVKPNNKCGNCNILLLNRCIDVNSLLSDITFNRNRECKISVTITRLSCQHIGVKNYKFECGLIGIKKTCLSRLSLYQRLIK